MENINFCSPAHHPHHRGDLGDSLTGQGNKVSAGLARLGLSRVGGECFTKKRRRNITIIRNILCSGTVYWRKFDNNLALLASALNQCLEHSLFRMLRSKAGQIVDFELVPFYVESPEVRKYGWGNWCACQRRGVWWEKLSVELSQVKEAGF